MANNRRKVLFLSRNLFLFGIFVFGCVANVTGNSEPSKSSFSFFEVYFWLGEKKNLGCVLTLERRTMSPIRPRPYSRKSFLRRVQFVNTSSDDEEEGLRCASPWLLPQLFVFLLFSSLCVVFGSRLSFASSTNSLHASRIAFLGNLRHFRLFALPCACQWRHELTLTLVFVTKAKVRRCWLTAEAQRCRLVTWRDLLSFPTIEHRKSSCVHSNRIKHPVNLIKRLSVRHCPVDYERQAPKCMNIDSSGVLARQR